MKLYEVQHQKFIDEPSIREWLRNRGIQNFTINHDLTVNVNGRVDLSGKDIFELPVRFNRVVGDFIIDHNPLVTLKNVPRIVGDNFICINTDITSVQFAPKFVGNDNDGANLNLAQNPHLKSLHNIHQSVKKINCFISFDKNTTHLLGLLNIESLKHVVLLTQPSVNKSKDYLPIQIINKYLQANLNDRDIFACQDELIQAGFPEQAKL